MKNITYIHVTLSQKYILNQKTKKYAWREEIKDMEGKWTGKQLEEKSSIQLKEIYSNACDDDLVSCKKPKYIEEYNKAVEDILEKVKIHDKLKDNYSSTPTKTSWKKEDFEIEDEIRKLKERNNFRKSTIQDEIKAPTFSERYLQRQINKKTEVNSAPKEVKKGAWRKDFARYEEDLEIKKLRKDTEKKIHSLDGEDSTPYVTTNSRVKKICLQIVDKQTVNVDFKPSPVQTTHSRSTNPGQKSGDYFEDSPTTFAGVKLARQTETPVDDSLAIQPARVHQKKDVAENDRAVTKNNKDQSNDKPSSHGEGEDYSSAKKIPEQSKDTKRSKDSEKKVVNMKTESKEESKRKESEVKDFKSEEITATTEKVRDEKVTSNPKKVVVAEKVEKEDEEEEDEDGMRAMRKETNNTLASLEAEFEAGRSKLAAVRARIRRAREMARTTDED